MEFALNGAAILTQSEEGLSSWESHRQKRPKECNLSEAIGSLYIGPKFWKTDPKEELIFGSILENFPSAIFHSSVWQISLECLLWTNTVVLWIWWQAKHAHCLVSERDNNQTLWQITCNYKLKWGLWEENKGHQESMWQEELMQSGGGGTQGTPPERVTIKWVP